MNTSVMPAVKTVASHGIVGALGAAAAAIALSAVMHAGASVNASQLARMEWSGVQCSVFRVGSCA